MTLYVLQYLERKECEKLELFQRSAKGNKNTGCALLYTNIEILKNQ